MSKVGPIYDLKDESQVKDYLKDLKIEYSYQCYSEKLPEGCHRLADFYSSIKKETEKATELYRQNCLDNKYGHSCFKIGNITLSESKGDDDTKQINEALRFFETACELDYFSACHNAALIHHKKKHYTEVEQLMAKSCQNKIKNSCYLLGAYYLTGKFGIAKNLQEAFKYTEIGCQNKHVGCCVNLSQMYKNGHGVAKDLEKSKEFRKKAETLHAERDEQTITFS